MPVVPSPLALVVMVAAMLEKLLFLDTWKIQPFSFPEGLAEVTAFLTVIAPAGEVLVTEPTLMVLPLTVP